MYAIVWSETKRVGFVAALIEGKRLDSLYSLTVGFASTAGTRSIYCDKTG